MQCLTCPVVDLLAGWDPNLPFRHMLCRQQQTCVAGACFEYSDVRYRNEAAVCIAGASAAWDPIRPVLHLGPGRPSESQDEQQAQVIPSSYRLLSSCLVLFSMADGKAHLSSTLDQLSGNARCHLMQESITVSLKGSSAQTGRALYGMCKRSEQWCGNKSYNFHLLNSSDVACMKALLRLDAISMAACDLFTASSHSRSTQQGAQSLLQPAICKNGRQELLSEHRQGSPLACAGAASLALLT